MLIITPYQYQRWLILYVFARVSEAFMGVLCNSHGVWYWSYSSLFREKKKNNVIFTWHYVIDVCLFLDYTRQKRRKMKWRKKNSPKYGCFPYRQCWYEIWPISRRVRFVIMKDKSWLNWSMKCRMYSLNDMVLEIQRLYLWKATTISLLLRKNMLNVRRSQESDESDGGASRTFIMNSYNKVALLQYGHLLVAWLGNRK